MSRQPTDSQRQLRKMEQRLGVTLFERNNRRVSITPIGEQVLEHARRALEEAELVEALSNSRETSSRARSASVRFQHSRRISCS